MDYERVIKCSFNEPLADECVGVDYKRPLLTSTVIVLHSCQLSSDYCLLCNSTKFYRRPHWALRSRGVALGAHTSPFKNVHQLREPHACVFAKLTKSQEPPDVMHLVLKIKFWGGGGGTPRLPKMAEFPPLPPFMQSYIYL